MAIRGSVQYGATDEPLITTIFYPDLDRLQSCFAVHVYAWDISCAVHVLGGLQHAKYNIRVIKLQSSGKQRMFSMAKVHLM